MIQRLKIAVLSVFFVTLFTCGTLAAQKRHRPVQKSASQLMPATPATVAPMPSVPAHEAAIPPQVSYVNGLLSIDAKNSTLSDILTAVEKRTGASFDIGSGDTSERVVGRLGPGPARDVLADLLNGSHFNYVMLSPASDPSALTRVVLTPRGAAPAQSAGFQNDGQQQLQQQQQMQVANGVPVQQQVQPQDPNNPDATQENADTPDENAENADPAEEAQPDQTQAAEGVKTPEQLLQDLQRQQQIIQQQQLRPGQIVQPQVNQ